MPISAYYHGDGERVMRDLKKEYGDQDGERAFYAIANKNNQKPASEKPKRNYDLSRK